MLLAWEVVDVVDDYKGSGLGGQDLDGATGSP
jgi:hypothetical protein